MHMQEYNGLATLPLRAFSRSPIRQALNEEPIVKVIRMWGDAVVQVSSRQHSRVARSSSDLFETQPFVQSCGRGVVHIDVEQHMISVY